MAHTCSICCAPVRVIVAPTEDGYEQVRSYYRTGPRRHDHQSWKRTTRARKQYARHERRSHQPASSPDRPQLTGRGSLGDVYTVILSEAKDLEILHSVQNDKLSTLFPGDEPVSTGEQTEWMRAVEHVAT